MCTNVVILKLFRGYRGFKACFRYLRVMLCDDDDDDDDDYVITGNIIFYNTELM